MRYLTARKRAVGNGAGHSGTEFFWKHLNSSILLQILFPLFIITFAYGLGGSHTEVIHYYSHPFPAIIAALTLIVGMLHLLREVVEAVEDYMHGLAEKLTVIAAQAFAYTLIAVGLVALARLAL